MYTSKKAVSEITAFVLLTLLVVVSSSFSYFYSKNMLESQQIQLDYSKMEISLKNFDRNLQGLPLINNSQFIETLSFKKGLLSFNNSELIYTSLIDSSQVSTYFCIQKLCYDSRGSSEELLLNLSPYVLNYSLDLVPGDYIIKVQYVNNGSKILKVFLK